MDRYAASLPTVRRMLNQKAEDEAERLDPLLNSNQVRDALGGISATTEWRWARDERVGFPAPDAVIRERRFWHLSTIRKFQQQLVEKSRERPAPRQHRMTEKNRPNA